MVTAWIVFLMIVGFNLLQQWIIFMAIIVNNQGKGEAITKSQMLDGSGC